MDLIEKYGSYDAAKAKQQELSKMAADPRLLFVGNIIKEIGEIEIGLLEYRRQHNIFEVGDFVFHTVCRNPLLERVTWTDGKRIRTDLAGSSAPTETFVHATDEEIKAGKRLEVKSDS